MRRFDPEYRAYKRQEGLRLGFRGILFCGCASIDDRPNSAPSLFRLPSGILYFGRVGSIAAVGLIDLGHGLSVSNNDQV